MFKLSNLTVERLRHMLNYDPIAGIFTWRQKASIRMQAGSRAGCITSDGYRTIRLDGISYYEQRLAYYWMVGEWLVLELDHVDLNKGNNSWKNIRLASHHQNLANLGLGKTNTSGFKGVSFYRPLGKWKAQICHKGMKYHLGYFLNKEDAASAFYSKATELNQEFARAA